MLTSTPDLKQSKTTEVTDPVCLYVVFSSTPYKMGRFIRFVTRASLNHVAISLDPELKEMYSFARRYRNTPLFGGFVRESYGRYRNRDRLAQVRICALPISPEKLAEVRVMLGRMETSADRYPYNLLSALIHPLRLRVRLPNCYTCVEFVSDFLREMQISDRVLPNHNYSVGELYRLLREHTVYRGDFPHTVPAGESDPFDAQPRLRTAIAMTFAAIGEQWARVFRYKIR